MNAAVPDLDVLGFISQCGICTQRALTRAPHPISDPFICPCCREVTE